MSTVAQDDVTNGINKANDKVDGHRKAGEAPVKQEYVLPNYKREKLNLNYVSEEDKLKLIEISDQKDENGRLETTGQPTEDTKRELETDVDNHQGKSKRIKKLHGQNKKRLGFMNQNNIHGERNNDTKLCSKFSGSFGLDDYSDIIEKCPFGDSCKFSHNVEAFMNTNPVYLDDKCYMYERYGFCGFGHRSVFVDLV